MKHIEEIKWLDKLDNMSMDEIIRYHNIKQKYLIHPDWFNENIGNRENHQIFLRKHGEYI
jgi:hypothetical protein